MLVLGASEITGNLCCNCIHLYWKGCVVFQYIFAVIYETLCKFTYFIYFSVYSELRNLVVRYTQVRTLN